ncbi:MAG: fumarate reductase subunit FrdD [Gammaproteobacteria bacterium]|nr:fumarate reductase subunit FrdD [Gammaproteobacteria bacterium]
MARSNKPMLWLPFAAGGTLAAFVLPALMLSLLLAALGIFPTQAVSYERLQAFAGHPLGKGALLVFLLLLVWHAAHRLRMTLQDLGVRRLETRLWAARICYAAAAAASALIVYALWIL